MSYPLSKFAYSFQQRFRELATPVETYHLQLADIDSTFKFKPVTLVKSFGKLNVIINYAENDGISVSCKFQKYSALDTIFEPFGVDFDNISDSAVLSSLNLQGRFELTKYCRLRFTNCRIDLDFLEVIKKWNLTVLYENIMRAHITSVDFNDCTFAKNVTIGTLVNTFPAVGHIFVAGCIYEGMFLYDLPELLTKICKHELSVRINADIGTLLELVNSDDAVSFDKTNTISNKKNRNQKSFKVALNSFPDHNLDALRPTVQTWQQQYFGKFVTFDKIRCHCNDCENTDSSDLNYRYRILFRNQQEVSYQETPPFVKFYYFIQNFLLFLWLQQF